MSLVGCRIWVAQSRTRLSNFTFHFLKETPSRTSHFPGELGEEPVVLGQVIESGWCGIPVELFQILKDDAVKVLHSIGQQIWKTPQWPQDWKRSVFIPIPTLA